MAVEKYRIAVFLQQWFCFNSNQAKRRHNMWIKFCVKEGRTSFHFNSILYLEGGSLALKWRKQNISITCSITDLAHFMERASAHQDQCFSLGFVHMSAGKINKDNLNKWHETGFINGKILRRVLSNNEGLHLQFKMLLSFHPFYLYSIWLIPKEDLSRSLNHEGDRIFSITLHFEAHISGICYYLSNGLVHQFWVALVYKLNGELNHSYWEKKLGWILFYILRQWRKIIHRQMEQKDYRT